MKALTYGGSGSVQSHRTCIVYAPDSGRIVQTHHHIVLEGGRDLSQDEMAAAALDLVRKRGVDVAKLKVLHTAPDKLEAGTVYAVDPGKGVLIEKRKFDVPRSR
jgi:hypothetical protein